MLRPIPEDSPFSIKIKGGDYLITDNLVGSNGKEHSLQKFSIDGDNWFWVGEGGNYMQLASDDGWNTTVETSDGDAILYRPGNYTVWIECNPME